MSKGQVIFYEQLKNKGDETPSRSIELKKYFSRLKENPPKPLPQGIFSVAANQLLPFEKMFLPLKIGRTSLSSSSGSSKIEPDFFFGVSITSND